MVINKLKPHTVVNLAHNLAARIGRGEHGDDETEDPENDKALQSPQGSAGQLIDSRENGEPGNQIGSAHKQAD